MSDDAGANANPPLDHSRELAALVSRARQALPDRPTQREIAARCGVSQPYWSRLERGELTHADPGFVHRAAAGLHLSDADRDFLLSLTGNMPPIHDDLRTSDVFHAALDAFPTPLYISDAEFYVQHTNLAMDLWFPWIGEYRNRGVEPNIMIWTFCDERARHDLEPWDGWAARMVAQLKAQYGRQPRNKTLAAVIHRVRTNPDADALWYSTSTYPHPDGDRRNLRLAFYEDRPIEIEIHGSHPMSAPHSRTILLIPCCPNDRRAVEDAVHQTRHEPQP